MAAFTASAAWPSVDRGRHAALLRGGRPGFLPARGTHPWPGSPIAVSLLERKLNQICDSHLPPPLLDSAARLALPSPDIEPQTVTDLTLRLTGGMSKTPRGTDAGFCEPRGSLTQPLCIVTPIEKPSSVAFDSSNNAAGRTSLLVPRKPEGGSHSSSR